MGTNPIPTKITAIFKLPTGSRGATPQVLKAHKRKENSPSIFHKAKEPSLPQQILLIQRIRAHIAREDLVPIPDVGHLTLPLHACVLISDQLQEQRHFGCSEAGITSVKCLALLAHRKTRQMSSAHPAGACGRTWFGWTCRRVYSLKKWDAAQLDFLPCLVLVLCEEEEGHLEAMRSL